ncbi:MAG: NADH-quinone oxidoreductase subunit D [Deltaproteobacteria bacterium]|nr:MAG: NADH-quinone oxidoreductase subunit D [Deltaproteobacteria bacterium]
MTAPHFPPRVDPHMDIEDYDPDADLMALNMGPQHPSTHGVFRIKLILDGERIVKAVPYPGYLHRGVEKLCEKLTYVQITPIFDKHDYVAPMTNEQAINMAFEKLLGLEVPQRAKVLRTILAELQRIASHLLWLGTFTLDIGGTIGGGASLMMYTFRERELILDLFEALTGCRFHYNTHCPGGNRHDVPEGWETVVRHVMDTIEPRIDEYEAICDSEIFLMRTEGVGLISPDLALETGQSGPVLRASGIDHDLRRDAPYHAYDQVQVRVHVETAGDCLARYKVRVAEMRESIRLVRELLGLLEPGPIVGSKPIKSLVQFKASGGQVYVGIETPRGELGTYLVGGGDQRGAAPYRCKIRPPSLHAMSVLPYVLPGHQVSDVVTILGSLDPIMGEVDR